MARKIPDVISQIYILQTSARSSLFHYLVRFSVHVEEHFSTLQLSQFPIPPPWTPGGGATPRTSPSEIEEHTRLSWSYPGWWWWSSQEETSPWINGVRQNQDSVDYRRLHQGLVTTTWHGLRFRTSGGGAYSPSSNLVVSSVQSCRGCRRKF